MPTLRQAKPLEIALDEILVSTGYTKEQIKTWIDNNIDYDGMTFDEIRVQLGKTAEELPDGYIHAVVQFYNEAGADLEVVNE